MDNHRAMDVQEFLDQQRFSPYQWLIFVLCFAVVLLDGFDTAVIGYLAHPLILEWGLDKTELAPVFSAALVGLTCGSLTAGPLADRFGRKKPLVSAVLLFALASLFSAQAENVSQLIIFRYITGLGLGAAMPNAVTLMSEYCPRAQRATLTNAMFCGFPLGAALGGFLAAWMVPQWGWRSVLLVGSLAPLLLAIALPAGLPESVRFMVARAWPSKRIRAVMSRIGSLASVQYFYLADGGTAYPRRGGLRLIFSRRYAVGTVMLWLSYFMGLVIFYALVNWMPLLLKESGQSPQIATIVAALFPLGGVGAVAFGWLMDRYNPDYVIAAGFSLTAIAIFTIGQLISELMILQVVVFAAGALLNTSQSSLPALAAQYYPTAGRATGIAWMLGVGRIGGIVGSLLVAQLAAMQLSFNVILAALAIPGLLASAALLVKQLHSEGKQ